MLLIQVSIGAANDLADVDRDAVSKPDKPLASGAVHAREARAMAAAAAVAGLGLSAAVGPGAGGVAAVGLALGYLYDLRLSRTAWSWLPLALALPLVPVHAWLGATGGVPRELIPLLPAAMLGGAALALANGLVDLERDRRSDRPGAVVRLGAERAWLVHAGLLLALAALVLAAAPGVPGSGESALGLDRPPEELAVLGAIRAWGVPLGLTALLGGAAALRAPSPGIRERAWELEAVGVAAIGIGWLAGTALRAG